jgi:hypothetical protein
MNGTQRQLFYGKGEGKSGWNGNANFFPKSKAK